MMEAQKSAGLGDWLDSSDVCRILNITKRSLQNYRHRGLLSYSKVGGKVFIKRSDILDLLEKNYHLQSKQSEKYDG